MNNYAGLCALIAVGSVATAVVLGIGGLVYHNHALSQPGVDALNIAMRRPADARRNLHRIKDMRHPWLAVCDRCGFTFKSSQIKLQWNGLRVCPEDFERRNAQDFVRAVRPDKYPMGQSRSANTCSLNPPRQRRTTYDCSRHPSLCLGYSR